MEYFNNTMLLNIIIMISIIYYFSIQNITLGFLFGVACSTYFYNHINKKYNEKIEMNEQNKQIKLNTINPKLEYASKDDLIVNFLFSIQDLYYYNPVTYSNIVKDIELFFLIIEESNIKKEYNGYEYQNLALIKNRILNNLSSLNINLPASYFAEKKIEEALKNLENILNSKLDESYNQIKNKIYTKGYDNSMIQIDLGPSPYNSHTDILEPHIHYSGDNEIF